jgi:hypothetical protein
VRFKGSLAVALAAAGVSILALSCGGGESGDQATQDTLTRREKDSILSTMPVPGAGAVREALDASDAARARAQRHDTIG